MVRLKKEGMFAGVLESAAYTTEGTKKKVNQDAHCILIADSAWGPVAFVAVCDGVGGLSAGELASSTVVSRFARWFEHEFPAYAKYNSNGGSLSLSALEGVWTQLLGVLNEKIFEYGESSGLRLGTTFSGLMICRNTYFIGHVGDCRVYRCRNGALEVLTNDQTLVARELSRGNITAEEAENHPKRSVLLQAVGTQEAVRPEFFSGGVQDGDRFLVCCDGLYRRLPNALICDALSAMRFASEESLGRACEALAQQSMERGETDNITAVCLSVPFGDSAASDTYNTSDSSLLARHSADPDESTTLLIDEADDPTTVFGEPDKEHEANSDLDDPTTILDQDSSRKGGDC